MKITHSRGATGPLFGVRFTDGVGNTDDPAALAKLARQGHRIEPELDDTQEIPIVKDDDES